MNNQPESYEGIRLTYITHYYVDGSSGNAVMKLLERYQGYDKELMSMIHFVLVDDCSPTPINVDGYDLNIDLIRVNEDIPWNQAGARNVGAVYAKSDKILLSDIDHVFPEHTLRELVQRRNPKSTFYKFYRKNATGNIHKGHPNTFFMSRARFFRFYGYDEEFTGKYGAEDYRFVKNQKYHGSRQKYLSERFWCARRRDLNKKDDYHSLIRDHSENTPIDSRKAKEIRLYGGEYGHSRQFLNFTWKHEKISRIAPPIPTLNRQWWPFWWIRTLIGSWK